MQLQQNKAFGVSDNLCMCPRVGWHKGFHSIKTSLCWQPLTIEHLCGWSGGVPGKPSVLPPGSIGQLKKKTPNTPFWINDGAYLHAHKPGLPDWHDEACLVVQFWFQQDQKQNKKEPKNSHVWVQNIQGKSRVQMDTKLAFVTSLVLVNYECVVV